MALRELASGFKARGLEQERQQVRSRYPGSEVDLNYSPGVLLSLIRPVETVAKHTQ